MKKLLIIPFSILLGIVILLSPSPFFVGATANISLEERVSELEQRVSSLESSERQSLVPSRVTSLSSFSGQGSTQTLPFRIDSYPCKIQLEVATDSPSIFWIRVQDPTKPELLSIGVARHFWLVMDGDNPTYEVVSYVPTGVYFLEVETGSWVKWSIRVTGY